MRRRLIVLLFWFYSGLCQAVFLEEFPNLKDFVFNEPTSSTYFGLGLSPISIMNSKLYVAANLFQIHWINDRFDIEIFSASIGSTINSEDYSSSKHFTFRTIPKYRIFSFISIGPLLGFEFVRFSNITARLYKDRYVTPYDVFSSNGLIYGLGISETIDQKNNRKIKISQNIYKQTYSTTNTNNGWTYLYQNPELAVEANKDKIAAGIVIMLEISYLL